MAARVHKRSNRMMGHPCGRRPKETPPQAGKRAAGFPAALPLGIT